MIIYELVVASHYLWPKWRQLSVSIISVISILVIALVVWLIVVFFSVTHGLENSWLQKLVAVTAPARLTPSPAYYQSYYYLIDGVSEQSDYTLKSIAEKRLATAVDPYDPDRDGELPEGWPAADLREDGTLKDLVQEAFAAIQAVKDVKGLSAYEFEVAPVTVHLALSRGMGQVSQRQYISQDMLIGALEPTNPAVTNTLLPLAAADIDNVLRQLYVASVHEEGVNIAPFKTIQKRLQHFFERVEVEAVRHSGQEDQEILVAEVVPESLLKARRGNEVQFTTAASTPAASSSSKITLGEHVIERFRWRTPGEASEDNCLWLTPVYKADHTLATLTLPALEDGGDGVVLPKGFREAGVRIGDRGWLAYSGATTSAVQEQRLPIQVAGFYDPGIIPLGGKFVLGGRHLPAIIRAAQHQTEVSASSGIQIAFTDLSQTEDFKNKLLHELHQRGLSPYWQLETFQDYPYARDLLQQLHSERNLFTLLAAIIIAVACSNIVSMLIILVNDKRQEIGILRAMGATTWSVATIFGFCGAIMGLAGSLIGIVLALVTLRYLQTLINLLSALQGHELLNPLFYGEQLPTGVSYEALLFVIAATGMLSLLAGIIPAIKAALVRPAELLRAE